MALRVGQTRRGTTYPQAPGYTTIPAWSRGNGEYKELSPFYLGPIAEENSPTANNFENFWQYSKVYASDISSTGTLLASWYTWQQEGFQQKSANRHPRPGQKPLYLLYQGQKHDLLSARRNVYLLFYQRLARATPVYKKLLARLKNGENLLLIEPDGPNRLLFPAGLPVTRDRLEKLLVVTTQGELHTLLGIDPPPDPQRYFPFGHGYALALALLQDLETTSSVSA